MSGAGKAFVGVAIAEACLSVGYLTWLFTATTPDDLAPASFYGSIASYYMVSFVYFAFDAVFSENKFQLFAANAMSTVATGYVVVKYSCQEEVCGLGPSWEATKLFVLVVKCCFLALYVCLTWSVQNSFGYSAYYLVGTDTKLIKRYTNFLQLWTLLRLDCTLNISLIAMYGFFFRSGFDEFTEYMGLPLFFAISGGAVGLALLQVALGWLAAVRELVALLWVVVLCCGLQLCYSGWKLSCFLQPSCTLTADISRLQAICISSASLLLKLMLCLACFTVFRGFGSGLRPLVFERHIPLAKSDAIGMHRDRQ